jgi:outer membrane protein
MDHKLFLRLAVLAGALLAVGAPAFGQSKIAVLNLQQALLDTADMKKAQADLDTKYKKQTDTLNKLNQEMADIQKQLQTLGNKLTPQAQQELVASGQRKQKDAQRLQEDLQADVERDRMDILEKARVKMEAVVNKLAEEKGYDLVLDASTTFFSKPAFDISKEVTAAYDKAHPVTAAPAAAK